MDSIYTRVTTAVQSPITYIYMRICSCFIFVIFVFADIQSVLTAGSRSQKRFGNDKLKDDDDNNSERMLIQSTTTQATMPMTMPHVHMYTHYICVCVCVCYMAMLIVGQRLKRLKCCCCFALCAFWGGIFCCCTLFCSFDCQIQILRPCENKTKKKNAQRVFVCMQRFFFF